MLHFKEKKWQLFGIYLKMSGFLSKNVRYPRYQDTAFLQLWTHDEFRR